MRTSIPALVLLTALAAGCGDDVETTPITPTPVSPTTSTFSSRLTPSGAVARLFTATKAGSISATVTAAGPPGTRVGLGIGVPATGVARCSLSTSLTVVAGPSPQLVANVDGGSYCVVIFDVGTLTDEIAFDLTLVYP